MALAPSMACRDRGCVDDGWGRLRCPGQSPDDPIAGAFLHQDGAMARREVVQIASHAWVGHQDGASAPTTHHPHPRPYAGGI